MLCYEHAKRNWSFAGRGRGNGLLHPRDLRESQPRGGWKTTRSARAGPLRRGPRRDGRRSARAVSKVASQVGNEEAAIFRAHESILHDPTFTAKIRRWIVDEQQTAPAALDRLLHEYTGLFARTEGRIHSRAAGRRARRGHSAQRPSVRRAPARSRALPGPLIIVADELLPSQVVMLGNREVAGIVTQAGGRTSHAAILARSRGIPAVSGVRGILKQVKNGDTIVVDGREGHVLVNPDAETTSAYLQAAARVLRSEGRAGREPRSAGRHRRRRRDRTAGQHQQPGRRQGRRGHGRLAASACFAPSICSSRIPTCPTKRSNSRPIARSSPPARTGAITIRTLDLGGDKTIPYLGHAREANPFMGWRSIRLSFEHPEFFTTQIRADPACGGRRADSRSVRMMFPMITTLEEMRRVRAMVAQATAATRPPKASRLATVPIGLMLEVPAAAVFDRQLSSTRSISSRSARTTWCNT